MTAKKVSPRDVPSRDDYYMGLAFWLAAKSKDPSTQVGAIIISASNVPLGTGYNGPPSQINDNAINWDRPDKYDYMDHAEENAIHFAKNNHLSMAGSTIYITGNPCRRCMKAIIKNGLRRVVYFKMEKPEGSESMMAKPEDIAKIEEMGRLATVTLSEYKGNLNWMRDHMKVMESMGVFDQQPI